MEFEFDTFFGNSSNFFIVGILVSIGAITLLTLIYGYQRLIVMLTQQPLNLKEQTNTQIKALLTQQSLDKKKLEDLFPTLTTQQSQDMMEQMKAHALSLEVL